MTKTDFLREALPILENIERLLEKRHDTRRKRAELHKHVSVTETSGAASRNGSISRPTDGYLLSAYKADDGRTKEDVHDRVREKDLIEREDPMYEDTNSKGGGCGA